MGTCTCKNGYKNFEVGTQFSFRVEFYTNDFCKVRLYDSENSFTRLSYNEFHTNFNIKD